jgi:mono/diheme cytochrome c family protein
VRARAAAPNQEKTMRKRTIAMLGVVSGLFALLLLVPVSSVVSEEAAAAADPAKAMYEKKCGMCHGNDGVAKPMGKGSANFNDPEWQKTATVESIAKVTAEGKNKMPGFAEKLTPEEITAVSKYILTLK